ncbi:hypothetical protein Hypma_007063 [Hypsizygus marmoreus]|uniref:Uncharacterized protein n=1 Tax=Hypsizygus marmoreus TaxID=39966 RepID=A0A369K7C7_HYPMA|nr:hypothetical protein Hypma_007063 [Hypsizygus marmoreus]
MGPAIAENVSCAVNLDFLIYSIYATLTHFRVIHEPMRTTSPLSSSGCRHSLNLSPQLENAPPSACHITYYAYSSGYAWWGTIILHPLLNSTPSECW